MTDREIEVAMLALLDKRGTATACPSEIARALDRNWRPLMQPVRDVARKLQQRGVIDVYQRGRPIQIQNAKGPIRLRARAVQSIDYRAHPEQYVIGRGEQGVLTVEPYKSELLPLWKFKTPRDAKTSSRALYQAFVAYGRAGDFVGMDMARKFLQMGWTRSRRYANHKSGRKYAGTRVRANDPDATKAESAAVFYAAYRRALSNRTYVRLKAAFKATSSTR
ncbi:MAG: DUF4385 family protein [Kofleriaceae bacterium]